MFFSSTACQIYIDEQREDRYKTLKARRWQTWAHGGQHDHDAGPDADRQPHTERCQTSQAQRGVGAEPQRLFLQEESHESVQRRDQQPGYKRHHPLPHLHQVSSELPPAAESRASRRSVEAKTVNDMFTNLQHHIDMKLQCCHLQAVTYRRIHSGWDIYQRSVFVGQIK